MFAHKYTLEDVISQMNNGSCGYGNFDREKDGKDWQKKCSEAKTREEGEGRYQYGCYRDNYIFHSRNIGGEITVWL
jgi:hypothetical protein